MAFLSINDLKNAAFNDLFRISSNTHLDKFRENPLLPIINHHYAYTSKNVLNIMANFIDKYIAFIDVMVFSNLVNKESIDNLESYFSQTTEVLVQIKVDKAQICLC